MIKLYEQFVETLNEEISVETANIIKKYNSWCILFFNNKKRKYEIFDLDKFENFDLDFLDKFFIKNKNFIAAIKTSGDKIQDYYFINKKIDLKNIDDSEIKELINSCYDTSYLVEKTLKNPLKPLYAILKCQNPYSSGNRGIEYGWISSDDDLQPLKDFKKRAQYAADNLASSKFKEHIGGTYTIYTDIEKFKENYKKITGNLPNIS